MIEHIVNKIKSCIPKNHKQIHMHEPNFNKEDLLNVTNCIKSTFVSTRGNYINSFSQKLQNFTSCKYVLLTSSGTAALFLSLKTINVEKCEVLLPSMTFVATPNAIMEANGIPNFIDSSIDSLNISADKLTQYLEEIAIIKDKMCINKITGRVIKAIIIVHAYGDPANLTSIRKISNKYNIEIIEDGAGALGSFYNKKHIGTTSRCSILSFNGNKIITTGMGGAILFKNKNDFVNIKHLISTARISHNWKVEHDKIGYNLRMANINAALGDSQMNRIKTTIRNKKTLFKKYEDVFNNDEYCFLHKSNIENQSNHWITNLYLKKKYKKYHQALIKNLHKEKILVRELWKPQHMNIMYKNMPKSSMTNAINHWKTGISLPSSNYK